MVDFDTQELIQKAILALNDNLNVSKIYFKVESGSMEEVRSKESLLEGSSFSKKEV